MSNYAQLSVFVRASDNEYVLCELWNRAGSVPWEVRFLAQGRPFHAGQFETRDQAIAWAEQEQAALEKGGA